MTGHRVWRRFLEGYALGNWDYAILSSMLAFYSALMVAVLLICLYPVQNYLGFGPSSGNRFMNFLEVVYFIANTAVAIVAIIALKVARDQFRQLIMQNKLAENARTASIYIELSKRWDSPEVSKARNSLYELAEFYDANRASILLPNVADYICHVLSNDGNGAAFSDFVAVASFVEDIGLLCQKEYVRIEDINDIMGSGLRYFIGLVLGLIAQQRTSLPGEPNRRTMYAFTLWLYLELDRLPRFAVPDYGAE